MTLGQKILQLRKQRGLSQEQLAVELHVSRQALSKWELGTSVPELDKLLLLSAFFHVSTDYLLHETHDVAETDVTHSTANTPLANGSSSPLPMLSRLCTLAIFVGTFLMLLRQVWPGFLLQLSAIFIFEGYCWHFQSPAQLRYRFYRCNLWPLTLLPVAIPAALLFLSLVKTSASIVTLLPFVLFCWLLIAGLSSHWCHRKMQD